MKKPMSCHNPTVPHGKRSPTLLHLCQNNAVTDDTGKVVVCIRKILRICFIIAIKKVQNGHLAIVYL